MLIFRLMQCIKSYLPSINMAVSAILPKRQQAFCRKFTMSEKLNNLEAKDIMHERISIFVKNIEEAE